MSNPSATPWTITHQAPLGFVQTRILEWVTISSSRGSSWLRDWTQVSCIGKPRIRRTSYQCLWLLPVSKISYINQCLFLKWSHPFLFLKISKFGSLFFIPVLVSWEETMLLPKLIAPFKGVWLVFHAEKSLSTSWIRVSPLPSRFTALAQCQ